MISRSAVPPQRPANSPIAMMIDAHHRIEHYMDLLMLIQRVYISKGKLPSFEQRDTVFAALRYLEITAADHARDEQESLMPRLAKPGAAGKTVGSCVQQLIAQHEQLAMVKNQVRELMTKWIKYGTLGPADDALLSETLAKMSAIYRQHFLVEETALYPLARKNLSKAEMTKILDEMVQRRLDRVRGWEAPREHEATPAGDQTA